MNRKENWDEDYEDDYDGSEEDEDEENDAKYKKKCALDRYGEDITEKASAGKLEECFGREKELLELMEILVRKQKNNPVLVGEAGVGKTAIIELFATKIVTNLVPFILSGRVIISLDLSRIVAGSRYRGEFELRFQRILEEVLDRPEVIIFIDEIHNITGAGSAEGSLDAANILKPILSRSGFQCMGATTNKEYERIEKDPALNRRFQPIRVAEPTIDETINILYGLRPSLEAYHNVEIAPDTLRLAVDLSSRYIHDRFLPDKAIDLIDRAAAREVIRLTNVTQGSVIGGVLNAGLNNIGSLKVEAFRRGDIASEFVFQEIENAYRNCLLRWVVAPLSIPEGFGSQEVLSPLSEALFNQMRVSVLTRVDELLFSSPKATVKTRYFHNIKDLSVEKTTSIFDKMMYKMITDQEEGRETIEIKPNYYRTSLYLFGNWIQAIEENRLADLQKLELFDEMSFMSEKTGMYDDLCLMRSEFKRDFIFLDKKAYFHKEDAESYEEVYEGLSELETKRIEIVLEFLEGLKPVLQKGIIQSLKYSSQIEMNDQELFMVQNLLGYFSTETGRDFLVNLDDPELIQRARLLGDFSGLKKRISQDEIRELMSDITGIPIQSLSNAESQKLLNLEATLHKRVIGQEEAIAAITKAIKRSRIGIQNPNRPIASFLFCGPTGVGKTEVTKALAVSMFGSENDMVRFDMSEFMEKFTLSRLIGSPPGYIGYEEGGQLTDGIRRKPYSVVLFDEVEKAHPDILNILLQILEDGRLTDTQKRLVPFDNTIIIMTSNAAADEIQQIIKEERMAEKNYVSENTTKKELTEEEYIYQDEYAGAIKFLKSPITEDFLTDIKKQIQIEFEKSFRNLKNYEFLERELEREKKGSGEKTPEGAQKKKEGNVNSTLKAAVLERLSGLFLPEFLNRLDDIIVFQPLKPEELRKICNLMVAEVSERIKPKKIYLKVDEKVKAKLSREGYNPLFGARPLRRLITKYIEDLITDNILKVPVPVKGRNVFITLNEEDQIILKD